LAARSTSWVLGIDLGTTNTAAVAFGEGHSTPVSILHGRNQPVFPSVVSLKNPMLPLVGWLAKDMMLTDPLTTIYGWKRFIGRSERSEYVSRYKDRFPYRIHADPNGQLGAFTNDHVVSFVAVAGVILDQVRLQASAALQADVRRCVITVPAHYGQQQRQAVLDAGMTAGLDVLRLVNEPTAAALAFGVDQRLDTRVLIFDLGGGTFDATILELTENIFDVRATRGDGFLGGTDFDRAICDRLVAYCQQNHGVDVRDEPVLIQRLMSAAENAKVCLSKEDSFTIRVPMLGQDERGRPLDLQYRLDRTELQQLTAPLVERTLGIVEEMLSSADIAPSQIQHCIMVGGMSGMPLVRERLEALMGRPPLTHLDPETAIAHGAALVARAEGDLGGAVLLDVLSVPVGLVYPGGKTAWVFESNARLPAVSVVPIPSPPVGKELAVGVWQGSDITSAERQVLGVVHVPAGLFSSGGPFSLGFGMSDKMELTVEFISQTQRWPLTIATPARG
jgi:molecular chaperone DnaK